jgi:hypothetical protein
VGSAGQEGSIGGLCTEVYPDTRRDQLQYSVPVGIVVLMVKVDRAKMAGLSFLVGTLSWSGWGI